MLSILLVMMTPTAEAGVVVNGPQLNCEWNQATGKLECTPVKVDKPDPDDLPLIASDAEADSSHGLPDGLFAQWRGDEAWEMYVLVSDNGKGAGVYGQALKNVPKAVASDQWDVDRDGWDDLLLEDGRGWRVYAGPLEDVVDYEDYTEIVK